MTPPLLQELHKVFLILLHDVLIYDIVELLREHILDASKVAVELDGIFHEHNLSVEELVSILLTLQHDF